MARLRRLGAALVLVELAACAPPAAAPPPTNARATAAPPQGVEPPPKELPPELPLRVVKPAWDELPNGLRIATLTVPGEARVELRAAVFVGRAADGERPGLVALTAAAMREGGAGGLTPAEVESRLAAIGARLDVSVGPDAIVFALGAPQERLVEAADLLGKVVTRPAFASAEIDRLKKREIARVTEAARASDGWAASMVMFGDLFSLPTDHHPYASFDATATDLGRIGAGDCRALHRRYVVSRSAAVVAAGALTKAEVRAAVAKSFGALPAGEAPAIAFPDPFPPDRRRVTLVDRPGASASEIDVGVLGPERGDAKWPAFAIAAALVDGGAAQEVAHGPGLLMARARVDATATGTRLDAMLGELAALEQKAPDDEAVEAGRRALSNALAGARQTAGGLADGLVRARALGLTDDDDTVFRTGLRDVTPAFLTRVAGEHLRSGHEVVVVVGDAGVIGPQLQRFGEVKIVDATRDFARVRTLRAAGPAPLP